MKKIFIVSFLVFLIIFSLFIDFKIEGFSSYNDFIRYVTTVINDLKVYNDKNHVRYITKYDIINDLLRLLNCNSLGNHKFSVVNIDIPEGSNDFSVLFYDKSTASAPTIIVENDFNTETNDDKKISYYTIKNIYIQSQSQSIATDYYDPYFQNNIYPY